MKKYLLAFSILLFSLVSYSQCEYPMGDFEGDFIDLTAAIDEAGVLAEGTVITPQGHTSLIRFITMFFAGFFIEPDSPEFQELWSNGLGLLPSDDAFEGEQALRIGGDEVVNLADIYTASNCTEIPDGLQFSYKHIGEGNDTLSVIALSTMGLGQLPETEEELEDVPGYISWEVVLDSTQEEYTTINIPFTDNMLGMEVDTVTAFFIITGNVDFFEGGGESYFLLDAISYTTEMVAVDEDMDGFNSDVDCDDTNADINPDATEIANNDVDENCDGEVLVIDEDMDGFNSDEDCDDSNADINPDATEVANNDIDEDCDGEALIIDEDMDGFNSDEDCDDSNADINPDATEVANNDIDEDCDGEALIIDEDMDGFNSDEDCDDDNADINPDAIEIPDNGIDEDCSGADLTAVEDISKIDVKIYPNPASSFINLESDEKFDIEIIDMSGRTVLNVKSFRLSHKVSLENIPNGLYIAKLKDENDKAQFRKFYVTQ